MRDDDALGAPGGARGIEYASRGIAINDDKVMRRRHACGDVDDRDVHFSEPPFGVIDIVMRGKGTDEWHVLDNEVQLLWRKCRVHRDIDCANAQTGQHADNRVDAAGRKQCDMLAGLNRHHLQHSCDRGHARVQLLIAQRLVLAAQRNCRRSGRDLRVEMGGNGILRRQFAH